MAKRKDKRGERAQIKIQLRDSDEAWYASDIVARWKNERLASQKIIGAIRLLDSLDSGDVSVLRELYPFLTSALTSRAPTASDVGFDMPLTPTGFKPITAREAKPKTHDESIDDFLDMF